MLKNELVAVNRIEAIRNSQGSGQVISVLVEEAKVFALLAIAEAINNLDDNKGIVSALDSIAEEIGRNK